MLKRVSKGSSFKKRGKTQGWVSEGAERLHLTRKAWGIGRKGLTGTNAIKESLEEKILASIR